MNEQELTHEVTARMATTPDDRIRFLMEALVRHLHSFACEVRLTEAEWLQGIRFLTETGQMCDATRQEFILLSDTLGLSSLVDIINHGNQNPEVTATTVLGPFYVPDSPRRAFGASMVEYEDGGRPAIVGGTVRSASGVPIPGAEIDVWQNAATGFYAVQVPDEQPATNLRGIYSTDHRGRYEIRTVRPVPYPIPADGPVGRSLAVTGRHPWRAAHIHAIVSAPGHVTLTTHIFDSASDYLDGDAVFGVSSALVRDFVPDPTGTLVCEHDFVLDVAGG